MRSRLPRLIEPFHQDHIQSASYELCLGDEVYISALPDTPRNERKKVTLRNQETIPIPPGQFAFLITSETIKIPNNALALISMKFKYKSKGLINVSGLHVDPGYSGKLIFAVYNAGPLHVHLARGERVFAIWYSNLDEDDEKPRNKIGYDVIPTDLMNSPDAVSSLPVLVKRLDELEKKVDIYYVKQTIVWGFIIVFIGVLLKLVVEPLIQPLLNMIQSSLTIS